MPQSAAPPSPVKSSHRVPRWMLLIALVLVVVQGIEVLGTLDQAAGLPLSNLSLPFSMTLRVVFAGGWLVAFSYLTFALAVGRPDAVRWLLAAVAVYAIAEFVWQLLFFRADFDRGRLPFQAMLTLLVLVLCGWQARIHVSSQHSDDLRDTSPDS